MPTADITVWAFHGDSDSDKSDLEEHYRKDLTINVNSCSGSQTTTTRKATTTTATQTTQPVYVTFDDNTGDDGTDAYDSAETPFSESPTYIAMLVLVNIVVFGLVIAIILRVFRR